jgi:hypothetical protein
VFRASDTMTFSPDGEGMVGAYSPGGHSSFSGEYTSATYADHYRKYLPWKVL